MAARWLLFDVGLRGEMGVTVDSARADWEAGHRRFLAEALDASRAPSLYAQEELVAAELRRRLGGTFTLAELGAVYASSEAWVRRIVEEAAAPGWQRTLAWVTDAAFHRTSRGAVDFEP